MLHTAVAASLQLAQETNGEEPTGNPLGFLLPILIIGAVFYLLLVLPQRRRVKKMEELRQSIRVGDHVRTIGGIYGSVVAEDEESFTIDVGGGTNLRVAKRAVAERFGGEEE